VLFSSWHGFFSWTPLAYVAALGMVFYASRDRRWTLAALAVFAAMCYVNGSAEDWAGGWAFGGRRFTSTLVALAPGLALAVEYLRRRPAVMLVPAAFIAIQWNYYLMVQYNKGFIPKDQPVSFEQLVRQQFDLFVRQPYVYPFAFPANAWFAWRTGLPIERYGVLAAQPFATQIGLTLGPEADAFLLDGWQAREREGVDYLRSIDEEATLVVPLAPIDQAPVALDVEGRVAEPGSEVRAIVNVDVNGQNAGRLVITQTRSVVTVTTDGAFWRKGYNRVTFRKTGLITVPGQPAPHDGAPDSSPGRRARDAAVAIYGIRVKSLPR
jgi:hypothetical protein